MSGRMQGEKHVRDVTIGDFRTGEEYVIRLFTVPSGDDQAIRWVNFTVYEVLSYETRTNERLLQRKDSNHSPDPVTSFEDAEWLAEGFVKWDGCTQFEMGSIHVDHRRHLESMFAAILEARRLCSEEMTSTNLIGEEYE